MRDRCARALQKWYFAEGCTRDGFETWFCIGDPNPQEAQVNLSFLDETGREIKKSFLIPAKSRFSLHVNDVIAEGHDISTIVSSDLNIVVERPLCFLFSPRSF